MNNATQQVDIEIISAPRALSHSPETTASLTPAPSADARVIAGYELLEHIGEGGYGAVWKAKAPGGMLKAVKLVHGRVEERRAVEEFKSLEKIRDARHPFLLSLERIEVVDGQLIVVTELADESLKQRYESCVKAGSPGIARDDLLRMLAEAADALDYMSRRHGLAHLDIKPENILLVGDHVKVADFGLVKSVHTAGNSLIGGLTPLFAAPETFDGKPSDRSDQYSLAVVYQYALTGKLPFSGTTIAQLAAQHTTARPDLSSLPDVDRPIIERALEKDPFDRFETCRAFVERLTAIKSTVVLPSFNPVGVSEPFHTEVIEDDDAQSQPATTTGQIQPQSSPIVDLPPLELNSENRRRPTLVIGLGGCGAKTLSALTQRLAEHYGTCEGIEWFDSLLIDTDYDEFIKTFVGEDDSGIAERQFVHLPLKPTQYYRQNAGELTRWLSRRWIYNIPKSQKPEGVRPLGRLALVDNIHQVEKQIDQAIGNLCRPKRKPETAEESPIDYEHPQVFLVGSLSGGTGGAIFTDVAQLVHRALGELERTDAEVIGVLANWASSSPEAAELAAVNSASALGEVHHMQTDGCPGDITCHLPALGRHAGLFKHVYYVDLGWHSQRDSFSGAAEKLAGYLQLSMSPELASFGRRCRQEAAAPARGISVARTFDFTTIDAGDLNGGSRTANRLVGTVLQQCFEAPADHQVAAEVRRSMKCLEAEMRPEQIRKQIADIHRPFLDAMLGEAQQSKQPIASWKQRVDQMFPAQPVLRKPEASNADPLQAAVAKLAKTRTSALHQSLILAVDESSSPVAFCEQLLPQLCSQLEPAKRRPSSEHPPELDASLAKEDPLTWLTAHADYALLTSTHAYLVQLIDLIQGSMRSLLKRVVEKKRQANRRIKALTESPSNEPPADDTLSAELAQKWQTAIKCEQGGLGTLLLRHNVEVESIEKQLTETAREMILSRRMSELSDALLPDALKVGGARRVLIAAPQPIIDGEIFQQVCSQLSSPPTLLPIEGASILLWCEGEQIKIGELIKSLVGHRPELLELANQLHVRNDVAWAKPM